MQFKYPEILYALTLLLIPIFIHLFQLRRFEKVSFTNVEFLKNVELQTRKSAKLKKFLILLSRLGLLASVILAFAQPYFSENKENSKPKTVLYIDNSLSMQAKDGSNTLLQNAIQSIIKSYPNSSDLKVITNNDVFKELNNKELKNQLLSIDYSPFSKDIQTVLLQANKSFKQIKGTKNHFVIVSDFQKNTKNTILDVDDDIEYSMVQLTPKNKNNISIDSVYIAKQNGLKIDVNVVLKSYHVAINNLPVSLYKDKILVGKTSCELKENSSSVVSFKIPFNDSFNGKIIIEDNSIEFDNELFFSLNKVEKINVLAIGNHNEYLSRIYPNSEFNLTNNKVNQVDYNKIKNQHLVVLNELDIIPISLQKELKGFVKDGGSLVIIPSIRTEISNYNQLFNSLRIGVITKKKESNHQINSINFSHPILDNVFEKQIKNFQYPTIKSLFETSLKNKLSILKLDNQEAFISQIKVGKGNVYWFASAISQLNSNFKSSPLIVPVFYNFGKQSYQLTKLYYTIGQNNQLSIKTAILNDEVLHIQSANSSENFIPLQQASQQKVTLTIEDNPFYAGFFQVLKGKESLRNIAFNYSRNESNSNYSNIKEIASQYKNVTFSTNIAQTFEAIDKTYRVKSYWKYFIILALLFLLIEILLIKFIKN